MKGLGFIKAKGKLTYYPSCGCCVFYNRKKHHELAEKIDINSLRAVTLTGYNSPSDYPALVKLFGDGLEVHLEHPVGEDVLFFNGKFKGYASDWMDMIDFAEKSEFKYSTPEDVEEFYYEKLFRMDNL